MILADRPAASTTSTAASQRGANGSSTNTSISGSNSSAAAITRAALPARSSRSRSADSADSIRKPGQTAPGQAEQAAGAAGVDHADRERRPRRNLARHVAELPVRHHQPARGGRIRALSGQLPGDRLGHRVGARAAQRGIVDRSVEGVHRNRLVAALLGPFARTTDQTARFGRRPGPFARTTDQKAAIRSIFGRLRAQRTKRPDPAGHRATRDNAGVSPSPRIRSPAPWRWYERVAWRCRAPRSGRAMAARRSSSTTNGAS